MGGVCEMQSALYTIREYHFVCLDEQKLKVESEIHV